MRNALFVAFLVLTSATAEASSRPVVAVFTLEGKGTGFKAQELDSVSEYVSTQLAASGRFTVVPRSEVKKSLRGQKKESYKGCYDESCQIEIGRELAAEKVVVGSIRKFGKVCMVNLRLFDLAKSASERAGSARGECGDAKVLVSVDRALTTLTGVAFAAVGSSIQPTTYPPVPVPQPYVPPPPAPMPQKSPPVSPPDVAPADTSGLTILQAARTLGSTRKRRSYIRSMAGLERSLCRNRADSDKQRAVCASAPRARACVRANRRLTRLKARADKYVAKRTTVLTRATQNEGQAFGQALDGLSRRVGACWCDPARVSRKECKVR